MTYGLTSTGFVRKRLSDIKIELQDALKLAFGENIDIEDESVFGQFIGIISESIADQWEQIENVYNSMYPSTASGTSLSNVVLFNGIEREPATKSTGTVTISGTASTVIPAGSQVSTSDTGDQFITIAEVTIGGGGTVDASVEAVETGPIEAASGTLTVIDTPIFGWTSVTNSADIIPGQDEETDAELRERRELVIQNPARNRQDSLVSQLLNLTGVIDALVYSNRTSSTDANGIPANQFLTVVYGGTESEILETIWNNTPQGIQSYGTSSGSITDSQGFSQTIYYTDPTEVPIYFTVTLTVNSNYPVDGDDQVAEAIATYGEENFFINDTVIMSQFYTPINTIQGIESITLYIGTSPGPSGTSNITIDIDEISTFDTSYIGVTS